MEDWTAETRRRIQAARRALELLAPGTRLREARVRIDETSRRLAAVGRNMPERRRADLRTLAARLDALSPLSILSRGYALAWRIPGDHLVRRAADLSENDELRLRFGEGEALAVVRAVEETPNGETRN
jgi:exodeoxyribonuclease VII large subunit